MQENPGICPFLGLQHDSAIRLSYADSGHRCYALSAKGDFQPDTDHQSSYCLGAAYPACPRYQSAGEREPAASRIEVRRDRTRNSKPLRVALWAVLALAAIVVGWQLAGLLAAPPPAPAATPFVVDTPTASAPLVMPTPDPGFTAQPTAIVPAARPLNEDAPTPTVTGGDLFFNLAPQAAAVGWVASNEARGNHLGDSFLHAGVVQDNIFHGVLQFDLSRVPRGAAIRSAALILTGLDESRLDRTSGDTWQVRWLDPEINEDWSRQNFQTIHNARVLQTILPAVREEDLAPFAINEFVFDPAQLSLLQQALVDSEPLLAFRLDGPLAGSDNLFTWDSGYGPASRQNTPGLWIVTGPAPATPPPVPTQDYVVVTSTPTPANVLTAAAQQQTAVALVDLIGTATPTPRNFVTATPTPQNESTAEAQRLALGLPFVVTPTPVPLNAATATADAAIATAVALTTGTWTPLPRDYVTATPTATFVVVTNTPTASNIFALLERVITEATRTATAGPPTPFPPGVVTATPTRTSTPVPQNFETAQAQVIMVTIQAITTGTWTPSPTAGPGTPVPTATSTVDLQATAGITQTVAPTTTLPAPPASPPAIALQAGAPTGAVISEVANIRFGPGVDYGVLAQAPNGTQLSLVGRTQDSSWLVVCCVNGEQGWVAAFLVAADIDVTTLPVTPPPPQAQASTPLDEALAGLMRAWRQSVERLALRIAAFL